jgi:hypothetical protein
MAKIVLTGVEGSVANCLRRAPTLRKFIWLLCLSPLGLCAQPQIGGGTCSSASLSGMYSVTLSGRDVSSSLNFSKILQGIGTATFDGLSKVSFVLTNNTNQAAGVSQTFSGTYSLQANCVGVMNITTGDTASFTLEAYNLGKNYLITGQDGTYSFAGSGGTLPASCTTGTLSGTYAFNGNGFPLSSGSIAGVNTISGLLTFNGGGTVTSTWYVAANGSVTTITTSGEYMVGAGCTGSAAVTDSTAHTYTLLFTVTSTNGSNFLVSGSDSQLMFTGSGRLL